MSRRKLAHELSLPRRTLLRGMVAGSAVALALPTLEAMLNGNGDAYADGTPLPRRLITWLFGNGCRLDKYIPVDEGPNYTPSSELQPLTDAGLKDQCRVLTGFRNYIAGRRGHHDGVAAIFSGHPFIKLDPMGAPYSSKFSGPSIDQVAADMIGTDTYFKSLQIGVSKRHLTDQGPTLETMSHRGPDQPLYAERDPQALYDRFFGALKQTDDPDGETRATSLDAVMQDVQRLRQRVSQADRKRLDVHLESVFQLQKQIAAIPTSCDLPPKPSLELYKPDGAEPLWEINAVMSKLVAVALSCGLTNVISYMFTGASGAAQFDMLPPSEFPEFPGENDLSHADHHQMSHVGNDYHLAYMHRATIFSMQNLAYFLKELRDTPEGDGSLLDQCLVLAASDVAEGLTHSETSHPLIVAGGAGGGLKSNVGHYHSPSQETLSNVGLACLKAVAPHPDDVTEYGSDVDGYNGYSTTPCSAIFG